MLTKYFSKNWTSWHFDIDPWYIHVYQLTIWHCMTVMMNICTKSTEEISLRKSEAIIMESCGYWHAIYLCNIAAVHVSSFSRNLELKSCELARSPMQAQRQIEFVKMYSLVFPQLCHPSTHLGYPFLLGKQIYLN